MMTRNVHYSEQPELIIITSHGANAVIEFPINVERIVVTDGDGTDRYEWVAEKVYSVRTVATEDLKERVEAYYSEWLELAKEPEKIDTTIDDLVEAINALT